MTTISRYDKPSGSAQHHWHQKCKILNKFLPRGGQRQLVEGSSVQLNCSWSFILYSEFCFVSNMVANIGFNPSFIVLYTILLDALYHWSSIRYKQWDFTYSPRRGQNEASEEGNFHFLEEKEIEVRLRRDENGIFYLSLPPPLVKVNPFSFFHNCNWISSVTKRRCLKNRIMKY